MDKDVFHSAVVFLAILLGASSASDKECTNGFLNSLNVENYDSRRLLPLLGQYGSSGAEQWIFPSLRFTCSGRVTKWIFRAVHAQAASSQCRINIGMWRLDRSSFGTVYRRLSTTEGARITSNGLVFTYELDSPVQFQPDDIVGVELSSHTCSIFGGFDNILSLDISGTGFISQSYRQFGTGSTFRVSQNPFTNLVPFIQPVIETATSEDPTIGTTLFTASNVAENTTTTVTDPLTSSQAHEEMRTTTRNDPLNSTTTEESSDIANTNEPRDKIILIIHIVAGVGIATIALLGIVVTCIGLVGVMKCMHARSAKGRSDAIEEPQIVISSSNGTLLQENTAYSKFMNGWSTDTTGSGYETMLFEESTCRNMEQSQVTISSNSNGTLLQENTAYTTLTNSWSADTTGYETLSTDGGRNPDMQNTSNSDGNIVGYETTTTPTEEQSKPDSTQPLDNSDSSGIVVQENTAYKKSTNGRDIVGYETTSTVQNKGTNANQCTNSSGIAVHKNTAYKKSTNSGDTVTGYETMDEIVEQVMQLNQAYGFQGESQEGTDSINAGDYETMTGDSVYDYSSQTHEGVDIKSTLAEPATYDVLIQQQHTSSEDGEHSYDYII